MLGWIAMASSFIGIFLNAKKIIWCWLFWTTGATLWVIHFAVVKKAEDIPSTIVWGIFALFNIYGWWQWKKDKKKKIKGE